MYFEKFLKCKKESKAERYRNRALELMKTAVSENGTLEDIDDIVLLFISLFRPLRAYFDNIEKYSVSGITMDINLQDAELLKDIYNHKKLIPDGIAEKTGFFDKFFANDYEKQTAIKLAYINNVLFLCRGLQNRGAFGEEE